VTALCQRKGTHRVVPLEQTRERIWPSLPSMGITRVANITGLDCIGIPVAMACRPNARSVSVAQGKGHTLIAAEVSAAMESIESYHAEHIVRPLLHASFNQLRYRLPLLEPETLPRGALGQFSEELKIHWVEAFDLVEDHPVWVPYELVHTDFTLPLPADSGCFALSSNGLASGNHLLEAISHGICELVERDSEAVFACLPPAARAQRTIRIESVREEECVQLLERFRRAGIHVSIWNMTTDIGIAAFRVTVMDQALDAARPLRPSVGMGCHPTRRVALSRALTEAAQARLTLISGSRDDLPRERYATLTDLDSLASLRQRESATSGQSRFDEVPSHESETIEEDVAWEQGKLVQAGVRHVAMVDLTKLEFRIPVVRMIVPGLETSRELPGWTPGPRAVSAQQRVS
jgi:YcaO-like protein with predicted kinase domain